MTPLRFSTTSDAATAGAHAVLPVFLTSILIIALNGCSPAQVHPVSKSGFVLDTACTMTLYDKAPADTLDKAFAILDHVNTTMTIDSKQSELINVNDAAGEHAVQVDPELYAVIKDGLHFSRLSSGAFDITVGPLVKLWGIGTGGDSVPPEAKIKQALSLIGYRHVVLNDADHSVFLEHRGMMIDLGGIAKGYAGDEVQAFLEKVGVHHALIDLGGNIVAMGSKPDGSPWRVGIQDPDLARGSYIGVVSVTNKSVVSSGQYERFLTYKGKNYGHILSTTNGFPIDNGITSTTIIAVNGTEADALSTSVFALGVQKGLALVNSLPGVEAIILTADKQVYLSNGMKDAFKITDAAYSMASPISVPSP